MMRINPYINKPVAPQPQTQTHQRGPAPDGAPPSATDTVQISADAQQAADEQLITSDVVTRVRAEIDAGTYLTPERIDLAIERLVEDLALSA